MEARNNKISQRVAQFSDLEISTAYKDIVNWKDAGVLASGPCKLKEIEKAIREISGLTVVDYRMAEDAVLMEAGRRFFNIIESRNSDFSMPRKGDPIWYVDFENGEIERGKIFNVHFIDGQVDSLTIDFESGDFDEFFGSALGECFFLSEETAQEALING